MEIYKTVFVLWATHHATVEPCGVCTSGTFTDTRNRYRSRPSEARKNIAHSQSSLLKHSKIIMLNRETTVCNPWPVVYASEVGGTNAAHFDYQSAVPSNWLEFSGVIPLVANNCPKGESTLIFPDMKG